MKKILSAISILLLTASLAFAGGMGAGSVHYASENVPQPRLIEPTTETVDLTGKNELEFKWSPHESTRGFRLYYDFRLYKGYNTIESALLFKKRVLPEEYTIELPSATFENGEVYTWSLRQVYDEGRKSKRSYQSFKVIKK